MIFSTRTKQSDISQFFLFLSLFALVSCAHQTTKSNLTLNKNLDQEYSLRLRGVEGRIENYEVYSEAITETIEEKQPNKIKKESVSFKVKSKTDEVDDVRGTITITQSTFEKKGNMDLNSLGFPELNEAITMQLDSLGQVLKAGDYPKESLFYVSPISLPDDEVKIGDTWTMSHTWLTKETQVPLKIDLVTILKNVFACGNKDFCLDLELSGQVDILSMDKEQSSFDSEVRGRMIFALNRGSILWSLIFSQELLKTAKGDVKSNSCILTRLVSPIEDRWSDSRLSRKTTCDAKSLASQSLGF